MMRTAAGKNAVSSPFAYGYTMLSSKPLMPPTPGKLALDIKTRALSLEVRTRGITLEIDP